MNTIKYLVVAAGLSLALLPASAAAAKVCDYGVFSVENPSDGATLYYSVRLGDDSDWVGEYTLPPRTVRTHYFALDADGRAPTPSIRFHDSVAVRQHGLEFFQVDPRTDYGMTYHFATTRSGRWDLFTGDAPGE